MFKNWDNRDWFWLTGILSASIFGVVTFRLSDNLEVINLFSFISSSISIALAIIAIYIALKQDRDSRAISRETSILLNTITGKVENMDNKIDKLDPNKVTKPEKDQLIEEVAGILQGEEVRGNPTNEELINEITNKINEKFNDIDFKLQNYYDTKTRTNNGRTYSYEIQIEIPVDKKMDFFISDFIRIFNIKTISHTFNGEELFLICETNSLIIKEHIENLAKIYRYKLLDIRLKF